jgi:HEAT repeat protein
MTRRLKIILPLSMVLAIGGCGKSSEPGGDDFTKAVLGDGQGQPIPPVQPDPMAGRAPARSDAERTIQDAIEAFEQYCTILSQVTDEASAEAAAPRYRETKSKVEQLQGRVNELQRTRFSKEESDRLQRDYMNRLLQAVQRMAKEKTRVQNIPGAFLALETGRGSGGKVAADSPPPNPFQPPSISKPSIPRPNFGQRPNMGRPSGLGQPPTGFGQQPAPDNNVEKQKLIQQFGADKVVQLRITRVDGLDVHEVLADKLKALADKPDPNWFMGTGGGVTNVVFAPVSDLKAFAGKIDFGKVTRIDPLTRTIEVEADRSKFPAAKPPDSDPEPFRPGTNPANATEALAQALDDLKSTDRHRRRSACHQLAELKPNERQAEVAKALEPLLDDNDGFLRKDCLKALAVWGTKETVPLLIKQLNDSDTFYRNDVIEVLGKMKDERAVEPIAARLTEFFDRRHASEALQQMGPMAEKVVLKYVTHPESGVAQEACRILKVIGTRTSARLLQAAAAQRKDGGLSRAAQEALFDIANREAIAKAAGGKPAEVAKPDGAEKGNADAAELGKELITAAPDRQTEIIRKLQESTGSEYTQSLADAIGKLSAKTRQQAREALAERLTRMKPKSLKAYLEGDNAELRRAAATACGSKGARELIPDLIALVAKDDADAALAAHEALKVLTNQKIDLAQGASSAERKLAAQRWNVWWQTNGSK